MRRGRGALTFAEAARDSAGTRSTRNSESRVSRHSPPLPWENPMQSGNSRRVARDVSFPSRDSLRGILVIRALHRKAEGWRVLATSLDVNSASAFFRRLKIFPVDLGAFPAKRRFAATPLSGRFPIATSCYFLECIAGDDEEFSPSSTSSSSVSSNGASPENGGNFTRACRRAGAFSLSARSRNDRFQIRTCGLDRPTLRFIIFPRVYPRSLSLSLSLSP